MAPLPTAPANKGKSIRTSAFYLDINTGTLAVPVWTRAFGIKSITPSGDVTLTDNSDWDDIDPVSGLQSSSQVPISESWGLEVAFSSKDYGTATYVRDPAQAFLEDNSGVLVGVRWYRRTGVGKAKIGNAWVKFTPSDNSGVMNASVTFTGDGKLDKTVEASTLIV